MKLSALKTAIRKHSGAVKVYSNVFGRPVALDIQKTPLLAELDRAFPEGKGYETGIWLHTDGFLTRESSRTEKEPATLTTDDDLLGGGEPAAAVEDDDPMAGLLG